ncbi:MAG: endonuclease III [Firmicutes bacterium]|nr:endonuclease III [Bacillota bacterium]
MSKEIVRQQEILAELEQIYQGVGSALKYNSPFQLLVAVMLSAQTNDNQVNKITERLFELFADAAAFAVLSPQELIPYISSCGLYKNKAKNIIATARIINGQFGGEVPQIKEQLTALPGVGDKTANVVLSVGFDIPALAVDTHVFRVARRLGLAEGQTPRAVERELCDLIAREKWSKAHHWLIWHGRRVCHAQKPHCSECTLSKLCLQEIKNLDNGMDGEKA